MPNPDLALTWLVVSHTKRLCLTGETTLKDITQKEVSELEDEADNVLGPHLKDGPHKPAKEMFLWVHNHILRTPL